VAKIKKTGRHTSGIKAHRQSLRRRERNFEVRAKIKGVTKTLLKTIAAKDKAKAEEILKQAYSTMDKAAKVGVLHPRNAARKKSKLASRVAALSVAAAPAAAA